jgi:hypothetical protein
LRPRRPDKRGRVVRRAPDELVALLAVDEGAEMDPLLLLQFLLFKLAHRQASTAF